MARTVRFAHSPDPDDAFMAYALAEGRLDDERLRFDVTTDDVESLNHAAREEVYDVTALSAGALPYVADRYAVLPHSASFGEGYGPIVVARAGDEPADLEGATVAVPGTLTTAYLVLRLALGDVDVVVTPFHEIPQRVLDGDVDLGLVIHEGQVTYASVGLDLVLDTGAWWQKETGLPLPLGIVAAATRLGDDLPEVERRLGQSLRWGLAHREDALAYARDFGRGISEEEADRFVTMYVSGLTQDMGEVGKKAIDTLLTRGADAGLVPRADVRYVA